MISPRLPRRLVTTTECCWQALLRGPLNHGCVIIRAHLPPAEVTSSAPHRHQPQEEQLRPRQTYAAADNSPSAAPSGYRRHLAHQAKQQVGTSLNTDTARSHSLGSIFGVACVAPLLLYSPRTGSGRYSALEGCSLEQWRSSAYPALRGRQVR